jgi:hypothetical protein
VALACCVLSGLWAVGAGLTAAPPARGGPNAWIVAIRDANSDAGAVSARDRLVKEYVAAEARGAGYDFAKQAAAGAAPLLRKGLEKDPLRAVKEVNLAMALSQMPQVPIQDALEVMVAHGGNPAVRYFGWKGYLAVRVRLLAQGMQPAETALAAAEKASRTETSAPVLEQVFRMLEMDAARPTAVSQEVWDTFRKGAWGALRANWRAWCLRVRAGDEEMAGACERAAAAAASHAALGGLSKDQTKELLQMLVDMAFSAGQAFVEARAAGRTGDAFVGLLQACESRLNEVTKAGKTFIDKTLRDPRLGTMPQIVILDVGRENNGVLAWVEFLKSQGVVEPKFERPATATVPAAGGTNRPAGAP